MITGTTQYPDSAADIWSGYIYQGKVALYHVLKLLVEDKNTYSNHSLQLDSIEDFSILDKQKKPVSMHQVKAVNSKYYSKFKKAFEKLEEKKKEHNTSHAFFHLVINNEKSSLEIKKLHPEIDLYIYSDGNACCALENIDGFIINHIKEYFQKNQLSQFSDNSDYLQSLKNNLENLIIAQIIKIHAKNHTDGIPINEGAYILNVPIINFVTKLNTNLIGTISDDSYFLYLIKCDFNRYYQEFCFDIDEANLENEIKYKLNRYIAHFNCLEENEMISFLRNIVPHRQFNINSIIDYKDNTFNEDEIKNVFFQILYQLKEIEDFDTFKWISKSEKHLVPTAINGGKSQSQRICKEIVSNIIKTDLNIPFETNHLITADLDIESIYTVVNNINDIPEETKTKEVEDRITRWKKVSLISLEKAKEELK